jgi:uncharacterized protein (UPF0332 family)
MTSEEALKDSVAREVQHGRQALAAATSLRDLGMRNDSLSRLYYAVFHLATALLLTEGVEPRRHRGMPGLLLTHLAGAGFDATDAARLARLATYRDMADYERAFDATQEILDSAFVDGSLFVDKAVAHLQARSFLP